MVMERTERQAQRIVSNVCASMRSEGLSVSKRTQSACFEIACGKKSASEVVRARLAEYKRK